MRSALAAAAVAVAAVTSSFEAQASLVGDSVSAVYQFPDVGVAYGSSDVSISPFIIGSGIETVIDVEDVTWLDIDFSSSSLLVTLNTVLDAPQWLAAVQNGPVFTNFSSMFPSIKSVTSSDGSNLVTASIVSGVLYLNWAGWAYRDGYTVQVDFEASPVPVPAALPLFACGMAGLGFLARMKRRADG